jgi:hypothetical protein
MHDGGGAAEGSVALEAGGSRGPAPGAREEVARSARLRRQRARNTRGGGGATGGSVASEAGGSSGLAPGAHEEVVGSTWWRRQRAHTTC